MDGATWQRVYKNRSLFLLLAIPSFLLGQFNQVPDSCTLQNKDNKLVLALLLQANRFQIKQWLINEDFPSLFQ